MLSDEFRRAAFRNTETYTLKGTSIIKPLHLLTTTTLRVSSLRFALLVLGFLTATLSLADSLVWRYNHAGAPSQFSEAEMEGLIRDTLAAWAPCGLGHHYAGTTSKMQSDIGEVVVKWDTQPSYVYGRFFGRLNAKKTRSIDGVVTLYAQLLGYKPENLYSTLLHEAGHAHGINNHDHWASSLMHQHAKPTARVTNDDIARCKLDRAVTAR